MLNYPDWMTLTDSGAAIEAADRAALTWRRVQDRPRNLTLIRDGVTLSPQTLRVETLYTRRQRTNSALNSQTERDMLLVGVRDHLTQPDADVLPGDRFTLGGLRYEVDSVLILPGELQAVGKAVS